MRTVIIVGGGFSGAMTAVHLLNDSRAVDLRVVLVESRSQSGLGVAYSAPSPHHLLNVPAGRMSALPDVPGDFMTWLGAQNIPATPDSFVPRRLYGAYISEHLARAAGSAGQRFVSVVGQVVDLQLSPDRKSARVVLEGDRSLSGEYVVLATGHSAPANPLAGFAAELADGTYTRDPWAIDGLSRVPTNAPILLIGAGLTMVDVAVDLHKRGQRGGLIALSRHGRLSQPQLLTHPQIEVQPPQELLAGDGRVNQVFRVVRAAIENNRRFGYDWRDTIKSLRPITAPIWRRFSFADRARFLRHLQVLWDTHRHQIPPESAEIIRDLQKRGEFQVVAGRITAVARSSGGLRVSFRKRGSGDIAHVQVGHIVNCTGAQSDVARMSDPLVRRLLGGGLISRDPLGLGVVTAEDGSLIDAAGRPSGVLFTVGSWRKAELWESTAVPELRKQAAELAKRLVDLSLADAHNVRSNGHAQVVRLAAN